MKKILLAVFILLVSVSFVQAATLTFSWTPNTDDATVGYHIIVDHSDVVAVDIPDKATSTATYTTTDNKCHVFTIYAYNSEGDHSDVGNMISICPKPGKANNFIVIK